MSNQIEKIVDSISSAFNDAPKLHELDDGDTEKLKLGYFVHPRTSGGVTVSFHFGTGDPQTIERISDTIEPLLDKRKFKKETSKPKHRQGNSYNIGVVELNNEGEIVDYTIEEEYLKPSKK